MNVNKKILALLCAVIAAMAVFTACGTGNTDASTPAESLQQTPGNGSGEIHSTKKTTASKKTTAPKKTTVATTSPGCNHWDREYFVLKPATCVEDGEGKIICNLCGYTRTETIVRTEMHELDAYGNCAVCKGNYIDELYNFKLNADGKSYTVSGFGRREVTHAVIPSEYKGLPVTVIAENTFYNNQTIESVFIPASITTIEAHAFRECLSLQYFDIESIAAWCAIDFQREPFEYAKGLRMNGEVLVSLVIPEGVTEIKPRALNNNQRLISLTLPSTLKEFKIEQVYYCDNLVEIINHSGIEIEEKPEYIDPFIHTGESALIREGDFYGIVKDGEAILVTSAVYDGLTNLVFPESFNGGEYVIKAYSFAERNDIETVTISGGVKEIGKFAFLECGNLREVYIGSSVEKICHGIFYNCDNIAKIVAPFTGERADGEGKTAMAYWFSYYDNDSHVSIVSIPRSVKYVEITQGTKIFDNAFNGGDYLEVIKIPAEVTEIGKNAFSGCKYVTMFDFPPNLEIIGDGAFTSCRFLYFNIPETVKYIGDIAFAYSYVGAENGELKLPEGLEHLGNGAFSHCYYLQKIVIPEGITEIGENTFTECTALKSFTAPAGLKKIGYGAFRKTALEELILPETVEVIANHAFEYCTSLRKVYIGRSIKSIGFYSFCPCYELKTVIYNGSEEEWNAVTKDDKAFAPSAEFEFLIK